MTGTVGQLLVNEALPPELRDPDRVMDGKTLRKVLGDVARLHPEKYRDISHRLATIGWRSAQESGGYSFGMQHLRKAQSAKRIAAEVQQKMGTLLDDDTIDDATREKRIVLLAGQKMKEQQDAVMEEALAAGNPLAMQAKSGARGNKMNITSLLGSDMLYNDHRDRIIPFPVLHSYSEGLNPAEYWAGAYGARKGVMDVKFCLAKGTLVLMGDYTAKAVEHVCVGDVVLGSDKQGNLRRTTVLRVHRNGQRACYRYRFRKGCSKNTDVISLVATEDHGVLAQIKAGRPGSVYAYRSRYTPDVVPLRDARLQKNPTKNAYVAYPSRGEQRDGGMREPLSLLAGLMLGDGCMAPSTHGSYSFSCGDAQLIADTCEYLAAFNLRLQPCEGSYNHSLSEVEPTARVTAVVNGRNSFVSGHLNPAKAKLKAMLGEKLAHEKILPIAVGDWDDESVCALVAGLFATDGGVYPRKDGCTLKFAVTSKSLALGLQRLLDLRLGIWTSPLRFVPMRPPRGKHDQWVFTINHPEAVRRFAAKIALCGEKRIDMEDGLRRLSRQPRSAEIGFKIIDRESVGTLATFDLEVDHPDHLFALNNGLVVSNSTQDAGYLSKQLNQVTHRLVVEDLDSEDEHDHAAPRGMPSHVDDNDNEGALLARRVGPYERNTVLTPKILQHLKTLGAGKILVRSPIVGGSQHGGVYSRDVGVREHGNLPGRGEMPGLGAVQALSEPLTQAQISSKHTGGVAGEGKAISGFDYVNQLVQVPKHFKNGAAHADVDGTVGRVEDAPAGGQYVWIDGTRHYTPAGAKLSVGKGDAVEAGDAISEGLPNPAKIVEHKGVGEGRRYFVKAFRETMGNAGMQANRRNIELLARGLINHVRLTDEMGDYVPDDVVPYSTLEHVYEPRHDAQTVTPSLAKGKYLEKPVLHYTIGTKIRPSVMRDMEDFGVKKVTVHHEAPPFQAEMIRGMSSMANDPDWMTRQYGSGLKDSLLRGAHRGATSDEKGTSFIPSLAKSVDFGREGGIVQAPEPGWSVKASEDLWLIKLAEAASNVPGGGGGLEFGKGTIPTSPVATQPTVKPTTQPAASPAAPTAAATPAVKAPPPAAAPPAPVSPEPQAEPAPKHAPFYGGYSPSSGTAASLAQQAMPYGMRLGGPLGSLAMMAGLDFNALGTLTRGPANNTSAVSAPAPDTSPAPTPASLGTDAGGAPADPLAAKPIPAWAQLPESNPDAKWTQGTSPEQLKAQRAQRQAQQQAQGPATVDNRSWGQWGADTAKATPGFLKNFYGAVNTSPVDAEKPYTDIYGRATLDQLGAGATVGTANKAMQALKWLMPQSRAASVLATGTGGMSKAVGAVGKGLFPDIGALAAKIPGAAKMFPKLLAPAATVGRNARYGAGVGNFLAAQTAVDTVLGGFNALHAGGGNPIKGYGITSENMLHPAEQESTEAGSGSAKLIDWRAGLHNQTFDPITTGAALGKQLYRAGGKELWNNAKALTPGVTAPTSYEDASQFSTQAGRQALQQTASKGLGDSFEMRIHGDGGHRLLDKATGYAFPMNGEQFAQSVPPSQQPAVMQRLYREMPEKYMAMFGDKQFQAYTDAGMAPPPEAVARQNQIVTNTKLLYEQ